MSLLVRDGKFDVLVVAGPRTGNWPSAGVRAVSTFCAEFGLTVGWLGGDTLRARGVLPLPGTGGLVLAEDVQNRIHRIQARAIVKVSSSSLLPDPFTGWRSQGLIPLPTAIRLKNEGQLLWSPATAILGTGNRAMSFGSSLLEAGASEVYCIETFAQWGGKRFSGWEVERRRFEMLGGKIIEAKPVSLSPKGSLVWEFRIEDARGIRVLDVARVVAAGPYRDTPGIKEYPPGSMLYELEQTAGATREEDADGWAQEEERGKYLACKIVKSLVADLGDKREELDRVFRRARARLKRYKRHREQPFTPSYQGKWITSGDVRAMKAFSGVPKEEHKKRAIASVECFENIACTLCQNICPANAITFTKDRDRVLSEVDCTGCGKCVTYCPSSAIAMLNEREDRSVSQLTLPWRGQRKWAIGEFATLLNRRGETLGNARVSAVLNDDPVTQMVTIDSPSHLVWEARGLKRPRTNSAVDDAFLSAQVTLAKAAEQKVEVSLNGDKRLVRDKLPLSIALFEMGQGRPDEVLSCNDGSCGMCEILVDGVKKQACQTPVHRGMVIRTDLPSGVSPLCGDKALCRCMGVTSDQVIERVKQGNLMSAEAVLSVTHVGEGKCHGQLCMDGFQRVLEEQGIDVSKWIDWRFPWSEWVLNPVPQDNQR